MLAAAESHDLSTAIDLEELESTMLELPQVECPVVHHFGPGIYIREVTLPAGADVIGHAQLKDHLNIMLTGAVAMLDDNGVIKVLRAPMIFVGKPGRKVGRILKTCVWQNIYATDETDVEKLEAMFIDKSPTWQAHQAAAKLSEIIARQHDREDFHCLVVEAGFDAAAVRIQSENIHDQIPMPEGFGAKVTIRLSPIDGQGVFLSASVEAGELIAPARIDGKRTPVGRYTNHSSNPNAIFTLTEHGDINLVALDKIQGCCGGDQGTEVTVDYRQALSLSGIRTGGDLCQQ